MIGRNNIRIMQHSEDLTAPQETRMFILTNAARCFRHGEPKAIRSWTAFFASMPISDWKIRPHLKSVSVAGLMFRWKDKFVKQFVLS